MPYKDKEKQREYFRNYARKWRAKNRERYLKRYRKWQEKNRKKVRNYSRKHYWANREKEIIRVMEGNKKRYREQRLKVILYYGGKCKCCGEHRVPFLGIEHINGGGRKHRIELQKKGQYVHDWIIKNNYPKEFTILCHNCNASKGYYGFCPHQVERKELTEKDIFEIERKKLSKYFNL